MNYKIKLNDRYVTEYVALPISIQKTVDESLDQASLRLVHTDIVDPIKPLSIVDIEFLDTQGVIKKTYSFFVSNDNVTNNILTDTYNHELALIEMTKWLERFANIVKCNTRPLIHDYTESQKDVYITETINDAQTFYGYNSVYKTPEKEGKLVILGYSNFAEAINAGFDYLYGKVIVKENGQTVLETSLDEDKTIKTYAGKTYDIEYSGNQGVSGNRRKYNFSIGVVAENTKKNNATIPEVVELLLKNFETLTISQVPRFALDLDFIEKYKDIDAPEINMQGTLFECLQQIGDYIHCIPRLRKKTGFESGITNPTQYVITFDELGDEEYVTTDLSDFVGHTQSFSIEQYATSLDSNIDNLINTDNVGEGALVEPNLKGWKTPRTDLSTVQITDQNLFIETSEAIEQIIKVECGYIGEDYIGDITPFVYSKTEYDGQLSSISDNYPLSKGFAIYYQPGAKNIYGLEFKLPHAISPVFKDFAILNIIRQKTGKNYSGTDIMDLQFRVTYIPNTNGRVRQQKTELQDGLPSTINFNQNASKISSNLFGEAIKGALAKLGNPEITKSYIFTDISQVPKEGQKFDEDYYISVVKTEHYNDFIKCDLGLSKNYNRKDRYMGLNSQIRFYEVSELQAINRQLYYEDYCIIGKDIEIEQKEVYRNQSPNMITLQEGENAIKVDVIGELMDFTILINNVPYGVSVDTNSLPFIYKDITISSITYPNIINISFTGTQETKIGLSSVRSKIENALITDVGLTSFASAFNENKEPISIDSVYCETFSNTENYGRFSMPLTCLSIGNSIFFHYEFVDNFTAGTKRTDIKGEIDVTRLQYQESYADIYGEFDFMTFQIGTKEFLGGFAPTWQDKAVEYGNNLPTEPVDTSGAYITSYFQANGNYAINVNKDGSEVIAMNYQVNFVTNDDIIIGTDIAKSSVFLTKEPLNYKLYLLPTRIRKYSNDVDLTNARELGSVEYEVKPNGTSKMQIKLQDVEIGNVSGQSWAICNGNKLIFGKNGRIEPNTKITLPFLTFKHII